MQQPPVGDPGGDGKRTSAAPTRKMIPRHSALPDRTPRSPITRWMAAESLIALATYGATSPPISPRTASPALQPTMAGRFSRYARPVGPRSPKNKACCDALDSF
jgi:hypothetical protein